MYTIIKECWYLVVIAALVIGIAFLEFKRLDDAQAADPDHQATGLTYISWQVAALLGIAAILFYILWRP